MEEKLKTVISNVFELTSDKIDELTTMESIEQWDSLKHLELIIAIEEKFGIVLETEEILEITSFARIKHILINKGLDK